MAGTTRSATAEEKISQVAVEGGVNGYLQQVRSGKHEFAVDEPVEQQAPTADPRLTRC